MTDNMDLFNDARTEGMRRAVEHADRDVFGWSEYADNFLRVFAWHRIGRSFLIEEVIAAYAEGSFPAPPTTKAWGAVVRKAAKQGWLVKDGFAIGAGNCCPKILWRHA